MVEYLSSFKKSSLVAFLGFFLFSGFILTSVASYYVSKSNIRRTVINHELPLASDNIHSEIQGILLPPLHVSATMANDVFLRDWLIGGEKDVEKITEYLKTIQTKQNMSSAFLVSDRTLNYYSYQGLRNQIDLANGSDVWYTHCKNGEPDFEINADIDTHVTEQLTLFINYKVFDYEGRFIGIAGVATQIESIEALIDRFKKLYHKTIYFVSPTGRVAFRMDRNADPLKKPNLADYLGSDELAARLLSKPSSTVEYQRDGEQILLNARYLPELKWYLMVEETVDGNVQYLRRMLVINLGVCLLITLFVLTIVFLTIQQYQKRLLLQNQMVFQQAQELEGNNQRLKELNYQQDEFMKLVVHDLKTPLSGIVGLAHLINDDDEEDDHSTILNYASEIEKAAREMIDLVQALLDLKEVESAHSPDLETIDVQEILDDQKDAWLLVAGKKRIKIKTNSPEQPVMIHANSRWINIIFNNLVSNAVKYSPEGSVIKLDLERNDFGVRVKVTDQGPGILPEERDLLFRQFSRLSSRPTGGESSSGLGLYIVKTVVDKLGGSVGVDSAPGHGSCFFVELPGSLKDI